MDLRQKITTAAEQGDSSIRKIAARFSVSKNTVERLITQKRTQGHINPGKQGGAMVSAVLQYQEQLLVMVEQQSDRTLAEYCELLFDETGLWISQSTMCRTFQRLNLPRKKKLRASQANSERVQLLRGAFWSQVTTVKLEDLRCTHKSSQSGFPPDKNGFKPPQPMN